MEKQIKIIGTYEEILPFIPLTYPKTKRQWKEKTYLYLFRLENNHVKGGRATHPSERLRAHSQAAFNYGATKIKEIALIGMYLEPRKAEDKLLENLNLLCKPLSNSDKNEWFYFDGEFSKLLIVFP